MDDQEPAFDLDAALQALEGRSTCLILTHDNPDPDAIAAAEGLRVLLQHELQMHASIGYGGIIGRAENRAMVRELRIPMTPLGNVDFSGYDCVACVDTQPGTGNNRLPDGHRVDIVIDHHPLKDWSQPTAWLDVRVDYGASSTIVHGYLRARGVPLDSRLATVLLYGVATDTLDLGRDATPADVQAYSDLLLHADFPALARVRRPSLPLSHYRVMTEALENAFIHDDQLITLVLQELPYPDLPAEMADYFLRAKGVRTAFCVGAFEGRLHLSLRTEVGATNARDALRSLVEGVGSAGGHRYMAGGVMDLEDEQGPKAAGERLRVKLANYLGLRGRRVRVSERAE